jgi:hypothetical protein
MAKSLFKSIMILLSLLVLNACNTQKQVELEVSLSVSLDGIPAPGIQVLIDGAASGETDTQGQFIARLQRLPGQEVTLSVKSNKPGYRIDPWQQAFVTKLAQSGKVERYPYKVDLKAEKYFTLVATADGAPLEGAAVRIQNKQVGQTDTNGEYVVTYRAMPSKGLTLNVRKKGYRSWKKRMKVAPVNLWKRTLKKAGPSPGKKKPQHPRSPKRNPLRPQKNQHLPLPHFPTPTAFPNPFPVCGCASTVKAWARPTAKAIWSISTAQPVKPFALGLPHPAIFPPNGKPRSP